MDSNTMTLDSKLAALREEWDAAEIDVSNGMGRGRLDRMDARRVARLTSPKTIARNRQATAWR